MVNVPSTGAQARLIGAMSAIYTGHFRSGCRSASRSAKAYAILERARGRAIADVLRTAPSRQPSASPAVVAQARTISQLQVRLMKASRPAQRQKLLDQLWEAEQLKTPVRSTRDIETMTRKGQPDLAAVRRSLRPDEVILEYVLSEPRSYCLVIGRGGATVVTLTSRKQIEQLVDRFTTELRAGKGGQSDSADRLRAAVLAPIAAWQAAPRIIIVPDGKLNIVPFDSLSRRQRPEIRARPDERSRSAGFLHQVDRRHAGEPRRFVGSLRLMSYLTPGRVPIGYSMTKRGEDRGLHREQLPCLDKLPGNKLEMLKMAVRFMVLNRDRSVRLMTEGLGPQPFHGRVVMLINEHTASAGEMVAAFAAENRLASLVGTKPPARSSAARTSRSGKASSSVCRRPAGTRGTAT